jgi:hypothetical protein
VDSRAASRQALLHQQRCPHIFSSACLFRLFEQLKRRAARIPSLTTIIMLPTTALICTAVMYLDSLRPARKDAAFSPPTHTRPHPIFFLTCMHASDCVRAVRTRPPHSFTSPARSERWSRAQPRGKESMQGYKSLFPHVTSCHSARRRRAVDKHVLAGTRPCTLPAACTRPFGPSVHPSHSFIFPELRKCWPGGQAQLSDQTRPDSRLPHPWPLTQDFSVPRLRFRSACMLMSHVR